MSRMRKMHRLYLEMMAYFRNDPKRIQHFIKVHEFAKLIGQCEKLDNDDLYVLEVAAIIHDVGIKVCEQKYGSCDGKLQEKEGPAVARKLLERLEYQPEVIETVCDLVGKHHTYDNIDSMIYQILVEADFLVNLYEENVPRVNCELTCAKIFKTPTGKTICQTMYGLG